MSNHLRIDLTLWAYWTRGLSEVSTSDPRTAIMVTFSGSNVQMSNPISDLGGINRDVNPLGFRSQ
jgi:hypothetical protein